MFKNLMLSPRSAAMNAPQKQLLNLLPWRCLSFPVIHPQQRQSPQDHTQKRNTVYFIIVSTNQMFLLLHLGSLIKL